MNNSFTTKQVQSHEARKMTDLTNHNNRFKFKRICVYTFIDKGGAHHDTLEPGR